MSLSQYCSLFLYQFLRQICHYFCTRHAYAINTLAVIKKSHVPKSRIITVNRYKAEISETFNSLKIDIDFGAVAKIAN